MHIVEMHGLKVLKYKIHLRVEICMCKHICVCVFICVCLCLMCFKGRRGRSLLVMRKGDNFLAGGKGNNFCMMLT